MIRLLLLFSLSFVGLFSVNYVYVVNNSGSVSVFDADNNHIQIAGSPFTTGGAAPFVIAINPIGSRVYIPNFMSGDIAMLDAITLAPIGLSPIGGFINPFGVVVNPVGTPYVYISDIGDNSIHMLNPDLTPAMPPVSSLGTEPRIIAINPAGTRLYIPNAISSTVVALDASNLALIAGPIPTGGMNPNAVAVNPADNNVYVTNGSTGDISIFDPDLNLLSTVPMGVSGVLGPVQMAFDPNQPILYVADTGNNTVSVLNIPSLSPASPALPSEGFTPYVTAVNPAGTLLYTTNANIPWTLSVRDLTTLATIAGSPFGGVTSPFGIAFSPFLFPSRIEMLTGAQKKNDFGLTYELFNQLSWKISSNGNAAGFFVYRDGVKIATLDSTTFHYEDHNRQPGSVTYYTVTVFDSAGIESEPVSVEVR